MAYESSALWAPYTGGGQPVANDVVVDTLWSDGELVTNRAGNWLFGWDTDHAPHIVAYRVR